MEACWNSGLSVVQWCQENGIAVSTYFSWQRKVFQALKEVQEVTFAEVPVLEYQGYHKLPEKIRVVGCLAHARRKFDEALQTLPKENGRVLWRQLASAIVPSCFSWRRPFLS